MNWTAFSTGARQGDARAPGALSKILRQKSLPLYFACGEQVHGDRIVVVPALNHAKKFLKTDGLLTDAVDQPLAIFTADCVPVFVSAQEGRVIGLVHAGWRGVQKNILGKAIRLLRQKWNIRPREVVDWAGPHIGVCCFEVQNDVARHFSHSRRRTKTAWTVDLHKELARQARRSGIRWVKKKGFRGCTMHQSRFYSYRRNQTPKRQVSVIVKRKPL